MRRTIGALAGVTLVTVFFVTGCGNLTKDEFRPEYETYKAENAGRFATVESSIDDANVRVTGLESSLKQQITDTNEETLAAVEQGDADTLAGARESADDMDSALRDELNAAIKSASQETQAIAVAGDKATAEQLTASIEETRAAVMTGVEASASKSATDMSGLRDEMKAAIRAAVPMPVVTVRFASGATKLSAEATKSLADSIAAIKERPNARVEVVGHADSRPILSGKFLTNLQLSEARAQAVAAYLKQQGVTNVIMVSGRGHFATEGSQGTSAGQSESRRVEVTLVEM